MSRVIAVCAAHGPSWPHLSGYRDDLALQEYPTSMKIARALMRARDDVVIVDVPLSFKCNGRCVSGIENAQERVVPKKRCEKYRAGLRHVTRKSAEAVLAVSFHITSCSNTHAPSGPFCLHSGGVRAKAFGLLFLLELERLSGFRRRWRSPIKGQRYEGVLDVSVPAVADVFGYKWFLRKGCPEAVIVEMGNVRNTLDAAWLHEGQGVDQVVRSALYAMRHAV